MKRNLDFKSHESYKIDKFAKECDSCIRKFQNGSGRFDLVDEDWACDEVTDLGTREELFVWEKPAEWNVIPDETVAFLKEYLERGEFAEVLKSKAGVAVGFVDGDIVVLYQN